MKIPILAIMPTVLLTVAGRLNLITGIRRLFIGGRQAGHEFTAKNYGMTVDEVKKRLGME